MMENGLRLAANSVPARPRRRRDPSAQSARCETRGSPEQVIFDEAHSLLGASKRATSAASLRADRAWCVFGPAKLDQLPRQPKQLRAMGKLLRHVGPLAGLLADAIRVDSCGDAW